MVVKRMMGTLAIRNFIAYNPQICNVRLAMWARPVPAMVLLILVEVINM